MTIDLRSFSRLSLSTHFFAFWLHTITSRLKENERWRAIGMIGAGALSGDVSQRFNVHISTVRDLWQRYQQCTDVQDRHRWRRSPMTTTYNLHISNVFNSIWKNIFNKQYKLIAICFQFSRFSSSGQILGVTNIFAFNKQHHIEFIKLCFPNQFQLY